MNQQHINQLLGRISEYISHDTYVLSQTQRNQLNVAINELQQKIDKEYDKVGDTLI